MNELGVFLTEDIRLLHGLISVHVKFADLNSIRPL